MSYGLNIIRIKVVYDALKELAAEVVFVGGATVSLYAQRPIAEVRPTGRGEGDGRMSSDFEDIVFVLNNRNTVWQELEAAPITLKEYLQAEYRNLLANDFLYEWIGAHLEYVEQKRVSYIIGGLEKFCLNLHS